MGAFLILFLLVVLAKTSVVHCLVHCVVWAFKSTVHLLLIALAIIILYALFTS